jgi:Rps23 Pro-64 3,4-dihydroxylase Tpa1-like proline 4-hydroxylase
MLQNKVSVKDNDFDFYKQSLLKLPFLKHKDNNIEVIIHNMGKNAGINWHADSHVRYGVTYYINKRWNPDWGGEFMFKADGNHGYLPVVSNSLVIIKTPMFHKVNPVLSSSIPRISIQSFIK